MLAVAAGGCGFSPLYGEGSGSVSSADLAEIDIGIIADRSGQVLRNMLVTRMAPRGAAETAQYVLDVELRESRVGLAVARDATATRTNLTVTASLALTRLDDGSVVYIDSVSSSNSYNQLDAEFATLAAEQDARERALNQIANEIVLRVGLFIQRTDTAQAAP